MYVLTDEVQANVRGAMVEKYGVPARWARRIVAEVVSRAQDWRDSGDALYQCWERMKSAQVGALPADSTDNELRDMAARCAGEYISDCASFGLVRARERVIDKLKGFAAVHRLRGVEWTAGEDARARCSTWWLRVLRRALARNVETGAIALGFVSRRCDVYASDDTVRRREQQNKRNTAALKSMVAVNEATGDEVDMLAIVEASVANKAIRRGELMTRIRGFEEFADSVGDEAIFVTLTCPSRFHARHSHDGSLNQKWDGSTPKQANDYLQKTWQKIRAKLHRDGLRVYGFRVMEPHHDGTPHAHFLLWASQSAVNIEAGSGKKRDGFSLGYGVPDCAIGRNGDTVAPLEHIRRVFTVWGLKDSPNEAGALKHRVTVECIDRNKGSAVAYVAKYIAKNIDGYKVGQDLLGNDAVVASGRIEAWATCWGIRQFQQVGGPPVGVWRELRRVEELAAQRAGEVIQKARAAVNRVGDVLASWRGFVEAMGGAALRRRDWRVQLSKRRESVRGRYETSDRLKPVGVVDSEGVVCFSRRFPWTIRAKSNALGLVSITVRAEVCENRYMRRVAHLLDLKGAKNGSNDHSKRNADDGGAHRPANSGGLPDAKRRRYAQRNGGHPRQKEVAILRNHPV